MCSEYTVSTTDKALREILDSNIVTLSDEREWEKRIKLTTKAPIIFKSASGELVVDEYVFPVQPFPNSRLSSLESKTEKGDDPQVRRIYDLPTWKNAFAKTPCLVPMSSFIEPVYWGDQAGTAQEFKSPDGGLLFVPGIIIHGRVPKTEKAFSLLTHTPSAQMLQYHHRLLMMLKPADALEYLEAEGTRERFDLLLKRRWVPELKVTKDRQLAKGWEKKIESHQHSLDSEKAYMKVLKDEDVTA